MIPKIIHYCWFGNGAIPKDDQACIDSWKALMPDYEIKRWDETNFDITSCGYMRAAADAKKWAYVSDCARFIILQREGGFFLDTDVMAVRSFDDLRNEHCFFGMERPHYAANPGLIIGAEPDHPCIREMMEGYLVREFINPDIDPGAPTSPTYATQILKQHGFVQENRLQKLDDITVYPIEFFAPMDYVTGETDCTENTYSIHIYSASWLSPEEKLWRKRRLNLNQKFGSKKGHRIYMLWSFPYRLMQRLKSEGFAKTVGYAFLRLTNKQ